MATMRHNNDAEAGFTGILTDWLTYGSEDGVKLFQGSTQKLPSRQAEIREHPSPPFPSEKFFPALVFPVFFCGATSEHGGIVRVVCAQQTV